MSNISDWQQCLEKRKPEVLEARCEITTPMFLGNGAQQAVDIRPPSIKGALRFWWRALHWYRFFEDTRGDEREALVKLHAAEADLFGCAAKDADSQTKPDGWEEGVRTAQSRFNLIIESHNLNAMADTWKPHAGIQYLLGQGCYNPRYGVTRSSLQHGQSFTVRLGSRPGNTAPSQRQWLELEQSLVVWGLLGGLGSRGRRGLGSVSLQALTGGIYAAPKNKEEYTNLLEEILAPATSLANLPPFSALSGHCRLDLSQTGTDVLALLNSVGEQLQHYRAWGHDGKVGNRKALKKFTQDHDDGLSAINGKVPTQPARRAVFGLPHNYFYKSSGKKLDITLKAHETRESRKLQTNGDRRASPLFIHIHRLADESVLAIQLLLPAQFLPSENPVLSYNKHMEVRMPESSVDWRVITRYMDEHFDSAETLIGTGNVGA